MKRCAREEQQRGFVHRDVGMSGLRERERAAVQEVEVAAFGELRGGAEIAREEGPGGGRGVGEQRREMVGSAHRRGTIGNVVGTMRAI